MLRRILVLDAHPDPGPARLSHALASAYIGEARGAGHEVRVRALSSWQGRFLRSATAFAAAPDDAFVLASRADIGWAEHIVFVFPLWLGGAPALLHAFLEQVACGDFLSPTGARGLSGKSARLIVTMGMPALAYRLAFGAFGVRALARSVLAFAGASSVKLSLFGAIEGSGAATHALDGVRRLGARGA